MKMVKSSCCLLYFGVLCFIISCATSEPESIATERLCVDPACSTPISRGRASVAYNAIDHDAVSFKRKALMNIYSKCRKESKDCKWEVQLEEDNTKKRFFVSPGIIQETKKKVKYEDLITVPYPRIPEVSEDKPKEENIKPVLFSSGGVAAELGDGSPPAPYEVIDGTTIRFDTNGQDIEPSKSADSVPETSSVVPPQQPITETHNKPDIPGKEDTETGSDEVDEEGDDEEEGEEEDEGEEDDDEGEESEEGEVTPDSAENTVTGPSIIDILDAALNAEPGRSPSTDAAILENSKISEIPDEPSPTVFEHSHVPSSQESKINESPGEPSPAVVEHSDVPSSQESKINETPDEPSPTVFEHPYVPSSQESKVNEIPDELPPVVPEHSDVTSSEVGSASDETPKSPPLNIESSVENTLESDLPSTSNSVLGETPEPPPPNVEPSLQTFGSHVPPTSPLPDSVSTSSVPVSLPVKNSEMNIDYTIDETTISTPHFDSENMETKRDELYVPPLDLGPQTSHVDTSDAIASGSKESYVDSREDVNSSPLLNTFNNFNPVFDQKIDSPPVVAESSSEASFQSDQSQFDNLNMHVTEEIVYQAQENYRNVRDAHDTEQLDYISPSERRDAHLNEPSMPSPLETDTVNYTEDLLNTERIYNELPPTDHADHSPLSAESNYYFAKATPEENRADTHTQESLESVDFKEAPVEAVVTEQPVGVEAQTDVNNQIQESMQVSDSESEGLFSGISQFFGGLFGGSTEESYIQMEEQVPYPSESEKLSEPVVDVSSGRNSGDKNIVPEGECKSVLGLESDCADAPSPPHLWEFLEYKGSTSSYTFIYLIITAITVLLFTLGHSFIERSREDRPFIAKVNQLTHDLQVATAQLEAHGMRETDILSEVSNEALAALQAELDELRRVKGDLDSQLESQQQELEAATEAGLEINKMLSDLLTQKEGSDVLLQSVEQLQGQLDTQQLVIDEMNRSLLEKSAENETLQGELQAANDKIEAVEDELNDMRQNLNIHLREKEEITCDLVARNHKLEAELATQTKLQAAEVSSLQDTINEITRKLAVRESEFAALSETIEEIRQKGNIDTAALYDVSHAKAELLRLQEEKDNLQERLGEEEGARKLLEDHVRAVGTEVDRLRTSCETAEKEKIEAETRLTVLSNYFKEKETQLQKELGLQEAMWAQKQGDDSTIYERIKSLQEEVENYKSQNDILKKEILDQERGLKGQIATLEKKAHENWVAARQAERRLEESKKEAGQLRNMITRNEKSTSDVETKPVSRHAGELNGEDPLAAIFSTSTPPPMPFPPIPLDPSAPPPLLPPGFMPPPFMPMPPPHYFAGDRRPAPLGRMSSPTLNRFSPSHLDYDYDRMSPPSRNYRSPPIDSDRHRHRTPPSPSYPNRQLEELPPRGFRPVNSQRESRREYQESNLSSGHSSTDSLDKATTRHGSKV